MIRRLAVFVFLFVLGAWLHGVARGETFQLTSGELSGEPISFDRQGVVVRKPDGSFADRVGWTNFTQSALKQLAAYPKAKDFAMIYIEPEEESPEKKEKADIKPKAGPRLERPDPKAGFGALFASPLMLVIFFIIYLAGIYAGYEVALFRNYAPALVCGISVVAPVVGPGIVLCLPTKLQKEHVAELQPEAEQAPQQFFVGEQPGQSPPPPPPPAPGEPAAAGRPAATVYARGQFTFNRRFFETKMAGFLRVVPGEAEKDMVIQIKSARGDYVGTRLSKLLPNELYLQIEKAGASADVMIPFNDISEVQIRPRDAL